MNTDFKRNSILSDSLREIRINIFKENDQDADKKGSLPEDAVVLINRKLFANDSNDGFTENFTCSVKNNDPENLTQNGMESV